MTARKKIIRRIFYGFTTLLICVVLTLFFLLKFRLKETLQYLVDQETNGLYQLNVDKVKYGFKNQTVDLYNATLTLKKNKPNPVKEVKLEHLHLKINSFSKLLVGELTIRSLFIEKPTLIIQTKPSEQKPIQQTIKKMYDGFCAFGSKLELKHIRANGVNVQIVFGKEKINLSNLYIALSDFEFDEENRTSKGQIRFKSGKQKLKIDGKQFAFSRFELGPTGQFNLENLEYLHPKNPLGGIEKIQTKKLRIKLKTDFFRQSNFEIDTLGIHESDIHFLPFQRQKELNRDSILKSIPLFDEIAIHHVLIDNTKLSFHINQTKQVIALARQNLILDSLRINRQREFSIQRAVILNDSIRYSSKDRSIQLSFRSFSYQNKQLTLYSPAVSLQKKWINANRWNISSIRVDKISLDQLEINDLFDRKFETENLTLWHPTIQINHKQASSKTSELPSIQQQFSQTKNTFAQVIAKISEVYQTKKIHVINGEFHLRRPNQILDFTGISTTINYSKLISKKQSDYLIDVLEELKMKQVKLVQPDQSLLVDELAIYTKNQFFEFLAFQLQSNSFSTEIQKGKLRFMDLSNMDQHRLRLPHLEIQSMSLKTGTSKSQLGNVSEFYLQLDTALIDRIQLEIPGKNQPIFRSDLEQIEWKNVQISHKQASWNVLNGLIKRIQVAEHPDWKLQVSKGKIYERGLHLNAIQFESKHNAQNRGKIRDIDIQLPTSGITWKRFHIQSLDFFKPELEWQWKPEKKQNSTWSNKDFPEILVDRIYFERGTLSVEKRGKDVPIFSTTGKWEGEIRQFKTGGNKQAIRSMSDWLENGIEGKGKFHFTGDSLTYLNQANTIKLGEYQLSTKRLISLQKMIAWQKEILTSSYDIDFQGENFNWQNEAKAGNIRFLKWTASNKQLFLRETQFAPKKEAFTWLDEQAFQRTYFGLNQGNFTIKSLDLPELINNSLYHIPSIQLQEGAIYLAKDRTQAFEFGIEKPMLTEWIKQHDFPFRIDTLHLLETTILYEEKSAITERLSSVLLEQINGYVANIHQTNPLVDSLEIEANFNLNRIPMEEFIYKECYSDPSHPYRLHVLGKNMDLKQLSPLTKSILSIEILSGNASLFEANIIGNKDFSVGTMDFYYEKLQLKKLKDHDTLQKSFMLGVVNFAANSFFLKQNNDDRTYLHHERDKERWIINAWMKATLNGIFSSTGIISRRKAYRKYIKKKQLLSPVATN